MTVIGRRRLRNADPADRTAVIANPAAEVEAQMDRLAADATSARLFELERIHEDAMARHSQLASDYVALIDALHARSPEEWHVGEPATAGLAYLRHLEDEADRCGIDRRPPWHHDERPRDEHFFLGLVAKRGMEERFGLPEPVRTASEAAEDTTDPGPEDAPPPAGERAAETTTAPDPSPEPSGPVSTEDEPAAEQDCAETGDVA